MEVIDFVRIVFDFRTDVSFLRLGERIHIHLTIDIILTDASVGIVGHISIQLKPRIFRDIDPRKSIGVLERRQIDILASGNEPSTEVHKAVVRHIIVEDAGCRKHAAGVCNIPVIPQKIN